MKLDSSPLLHLYYAILFLTEPGTPLNDVAISRPLFLCRTIIPSFQTLATKLQRL